MYSQNCRLWVFLSLLFLLQFPAAHALGPLRRQDDSSPTASPTASPSPSRTREEDRTSADQTSTARSKDEEAVPSRTHSDLSSSIIITSTPAASGALENEGDPALNATIPDGQLPLQPIVTPGWGVAGVLLMCTGAVYALIGIKNSRLHTFFSTAYLTGLGTAVLIIYIMVPPIPLGIQGAYVVAVVLTGVALGAIAMFFKEITEGLGCMLGGFCLSMWLLCLRPGGLVAPDSTAKIIIITCFTVVSFGLYFSRWTRDYTLIVGISFSGATATVLGIDCFSRAGLKEFWAYLWDLNENLFPLGAHTYPLTRGIEVELAAIVIICLAGIISQLKLWRIVKERRAKKDAERAEGQRNLEQEEEVVGRQIEAENARERRLWERTYGNGDSQSTAGSNDSGYANETDCEKNPDAISNRKQSRPNSTVQAQAIESGNAVDSDLPPAVPPKAFPTASVMARAEQDGSVMVRVAHDDTLPAPAEVSARDPEEMVSSKMSEKVQMLEKPATRCSLVSQDHPVAPAPAVVPLPFAVPMNHDEQLDKDDERSSVATYADEEDRVPQKPQQRRSLARRLSQMSMDKLRRMSHRETREAFAEGSPSEEELVIHRARHDPDNGSMAATIDLASVDGDERSVAGASRSSLEITAGVEPTNVDEQEDKTTKHMSAAETVTTSILDLAQIEKEAQAENPTVAADVGADMPREEVVSKEDEPIRSHKAQSAASAVESTPVSLTEAHLPHALSRVAMSYRTNEWAKHLSNADLPMPDTLQLNEYPQDSRVVGAEPAAPVDLEQLKQTAETGTPAPHLPRSSSAMGHSMVRTNSQLSAATHSQRVAGPGIGAIASLPSQSTTPHQAGTLNRQASAAGMRRSSTNLHMQPAITEERNRYAAMADSRSSSSAASSVAGASIVDRPPVPGVVSYSSPQTLIGQREVYLRNKSNPTLPTSMTMPEVYATQRAPSETGSMHNYPVYASQPLPGGGDADDVPLSQRREMMRRDSALRSSTSFGSRPPSGAMYGGAMMYPGAMSSSAETLVFDSHQPQRYSNIPSQAARESQLAAFRQSVQLEMRSATPVTAPRARESFYATGAVFGSSTGLDREAEVQRSIDAQRAMLLQQKEADAQRREMERGEKQRNDQAFMTMMQSGQWNDAHRDKLRRMQSAANVRD